MQAQQNIDTPINQNGNQTSSRGAFSESSFPIQSLPIEILGEVFILCLPRDIGNLQPSRKRAPLSLIWVCSRWRRAALKLPRLWTNLGIMFRSSVDRTTTKKPEGITQFWFGKAKNQPLSFSICCLRPESAKTRSGGVAPGRMSPFVDKVIAPYLNRCQKLLLYMTPSSLMSCLSLPAGYVDHLESLYLKYEHEFNTYPEITFFKRTPRLRKLALVYYGYYEEDHSPLFARLPWSQLTHLNMMETRISFALWQPLLRQCHRLVCGAFDVVMGEEDHLAHYQYKSMSLVDFRVSFLEGPDSSMAPIVDGWNFPALTNFEFRAIHPSVSSQLARHLHSVRQLSLQFEKYRYIPATDLLELLRSSSSLTTLKLDVGILDYELFIEALTYTDHQQCTLPDLESLDLYFPLSKFKPLAEAFVDMVLSRRLVKINSSRPPVAYLKVTLSLDPGHVGFSIGTTDFSDVSHMFPEADFTVKLHRDREKPTYEGWL